VGQVAWIALELVYLPQRSWLQVVYGCTGVALALLLLVPAVSRYLRAVEPPLPRRQPEGVGVACAGY
jgi:hypothetical protein